jgi:hypothetical protein
VVALLCRKATRSGLVSVLHCNVPFLPRHHPNPAHQQVVLYILPSPRRFNMPPLSRSLHLSRLPLVPGPQEIRPCLINLKIDDQQHLRQSRMNSMVLWKTKSLTPCQHTRELRPSPFLILLVGHLTWATIEPALRCIRGRLVPLRHPAIHFLRIYAIPRPPPSPRTEPPRHGLLADGPACRGHLPIPR